MGSIVSEIGQGLWFYGSQLGLVEVRKEPGPSATALPSTNPDLWPCPSASPVSRLFTPSGSGSALYGALVGGLFVLLAQLLANWAQRERDRQTEKQALTGTLRAIQAEVLVLRADFLMPLWDRLKAAEPGPFPTMPVQKNFFVVFESNAAALGRIRDPNLITNIASVYGQAKFLKVSQ